MFDVFFQKANELYEGRRPFALAVVVRHVKPISGKAGDKAIILEDGTLHGWIGGGCTRPLIIREARAALRDGRHRLVRIAPTIAPTVDGEADGIIEYTMTCHSGGALDIYIEPVLPKPQLVIFGRTEIAQTLARLGKAVNHRVVVMAPGADTGEFPGADAVYDGVALDEVSLGGPTFAVVATQGEEDEDALTEVLRYDLPYVAFVASRRKSRSVFDALAGRGLDAARLEQIRTPAGLDIGARLPEEIAVSILAEVVLVMRRKLAAADASQAEPVVIEATLRREVLPLGEMSCSHCVLSVEKALSRIEGVAVHRVEIGTAEISYDPGTVPRSRIVEVLAERGYPVLTEA
jgi:xanthine dehydrogenase accessory factor